MIFLTDTRTVTGVMKSSDLRILYFHINRICIKQRVKCPESSVCVLTLVW